MNSEQIHKLVNDILNEYIPKSKLLTFYALLEKHNLKRDDLVYQYRKSKPSPTVIRTNKIPIEVLRKKLNTNIFDFENNEIEDIVKSTKTNLEKCDRLVDKINFEKKKLKIVYYYFGKYLEKLKSEYETRDEFLKFVTERYNITKSTINRYIQFSKLCDFRKQLVTCDLPFKDIIHNTKEIEFIFLH